MLPKEYRLKKKDDFQRVYKKGRFFSSKGLVVSFINNSEKTSRFGFAIGKGYSKSAVLRNQAKRVLRSSVAKIVNNIVSGKDFVISLKKFSSEEKISTNSMTILLKKIFEKNKLLKK